MRWPLDSFSINEGYAGHPPALDLAAPSGAPIKAPESGKILLVNNDPKAYFGGLYIRMQGGSGNQYYMGHNSKNNVSVGQQVTEGEVIGAVGMTGFAIPAQGIDAPSGPHVHFECIVNNVSVDFRTIIKSGGQDMPIAVDQRYMIIRAMKRDEPTEAEVTDKLWDNPDPTQAINNFWNNYGKPRYEAGPAPISEDSFYMLVRGMLHRDPELTEAQNKAYQRDGDLAIKTFWNNGGKAQFENPTTSSDFKEAGSFDGQPIFKKG